MFMDFKPQTFGSPAYRDPKETELMEKVSTMTDEEIQLMITVFLMVTDRPDRWEFFQNWKGKMRDLPAALARI